MSDDIQQETKRIHRNIVESLSFSEALANRDAEIARLMKELEGADRIANNFAQTACLRGDEIERLRADRNAIGFAAAEQIAERYAEIERLLTVLREVHDAAPYLGAEINRRVRKALGDD